MEAFRLNRLGKQKSELPHIRISAPYYQLLFRLKAETGLAMCNIVEQCIDYAMQNGGPWEKEMLEQYTGKRSPLRCPLLETSAEEGGAKCPERM